MNQTFEADFGDFIWDRAMVAHEHVARDSLFIKHAGEAELALQNLKAVVPDDMVYLILRYEAAVTLCASSDIEYVYKQGIKDGMILRRELMLDDNEREVVA